MNSRILVLWAIGALALTVAVPVHAIFDEVIVSDNNTTVSPDYSTDFGDDELSYAGVDCWLDGNQSVRSPWRVYAGFDTHGVPDGYTVQQASLSLWVIDIPQDEPTLGAYLCSDHGWSESTLQWPGVAWEEPALDTVAATSDDIGGWLSFDVTAGFSRNPNLSFVLKAPDEDNDLGTAMFASDDWEVAEYRPRLELEYTDDNWDETPELSTVALLALTGLVGIARRRRRG